MKKIQFKQHFATKIETLTKQTMNLVFQHTFFLVHFTMLAPNTYNPTIIKTSLAQIIGFPHAFE